MAGSGASDGEVVLEIEHCIRVFKSGRVERYFGSDPVPASTDAGTGVASKDRTISPDVAVRLYLPPSPRRAATEEASHPRLLPRRRFRPPHRLQRRLPRVPRLAARARAIVVSVDYRLRLSTRSPPPTMTRGGRYAGWRPTPPAAPARSPGSPTTATSPACPSAARARAPTSRITWRCAPASRACPTARRSAAASCWSTPTSWPRQGALRGQRPRDGRERGEDVAVVCPRPRASTTRGSTRWPGAKTMRGLACRRVLMCLAETDVVRDRGRAYCDGPGRAGGPGGGAARGGRAGPLLPSRQLHLRRRRQAGRCHCQLNSQYLCAELSRELETLQKIEHQNLVRFLGFFEQRDETLIVVEYVDNGSLREHLDESRGTGLELAQRLNIAINVAHALTYLHEYPAQTEGEQGILPILKRIRAVFDKVGIKEEESVVVRITSCPNGCARPYMAEVRFVVAQSLSGKIMLK
ncbi:hypothetical protein ZWY2020_038426 [Hordeum vulgare]|nr:hypothetical protein ZWY2020_038426 [Hordeum vulgare]